MTGLKKVSGESKHLKGYYSPGYLQVNYDKAADKVWSNYHYDFGHDAYTQYHDSNIINCGHICEPSTMANIKKMIEEALR